MADAALAAASPCSAVRLLEDYVVIPRVLGDAVGLSPLDRARLRHVGRRSSSAASAVLLAIPLAAVIATLVDVVVFDKDPAEEEVPTVLFPAKDAE